LIKEKAIILLPISEEKRKKEGEMKKTRYLLVLALGAMLILGALASLNAEQKKTYKILAKSDENVPKKIRDRTDEKVEPANATLQMLIDLLNYKTAAELAPTALNAFKNTYLKDVTFKDDDGAETTNWMQILGKLKDKLNAGNTIKVGDVNVDFDYQLYDPQLEKDVDFIMIITTQLIIESATGENSDPELRGTLAHRRSCDPYP
jgi:hypothetical protein